MLKDKALIAMIAVLPLPGSPLYDGNDQRIIDQALSDLEHYKRVDVDALLLENDHDVPYIKPPLPDEAIALMTEVASQVRSRFDKPIGIQLLEAANEQALEIAARAQLEFIRVEGFVFAQIGSAGLIEACAGKLMRKRKALGCEHIQVFADVQKKHAAHAITADLDIAEEVKQAVLYLANGIVVTGTFTGVQPQKDDLIKAKQATKLPILIGSGMTKDNIAENFPLADAFIVGSTFCKDGKFLEKLDPSRLQAFMGAFRAISNGESES
jgi:uncharacterized protein